MYPVQHIKRTSSHVSDAMSDMSVHSALVRSHRRARVCPAALLGTDVIAFILAAFLAFVIDTAPQLSPFNRAIDNLNAMGAEWHGWGTLLVLVGLLSHFAGRGHYTARVPTWTQCGDVVVATVIALACDAFLTIAIYDKPVQVEGLLRWLLFCPCVLLLRMATREMLRAAGVWSLRTLIVASVDEIEDARAALTSDAALGYCLVGAVTPESAAVLPDAELLDVLEERRADFVVVAVGGRDPSAERAALDALRRTRLPIALVPMLRGLPVVGFRQHYFLGHDVVMLVARTNLVRPVSRVLKTAFDQIGAAVLVFLLAPLLLLLTMLVRADGGPALFRQRRIGAGGRVFECLKFRSMVVDADKLLRRLLASDPAAAQEWAASRKLSKDPRVTRVGAFLRRSSLDELPQLFNVLRGEMSLVGPRPIVQAEVARYSDDIEYYYAARPGLTGLWQVSGRSDTSYQRRVKLDVWYVRNWTLWHDVAILFKTIPAVFLQRGAR